MPAVDRGQRGGEVVDHVADQLVAVGEAVGERGGVGQQLLDGAALALQHLHQVHAQLVDLLGVERLEQRLEPVEERGQVEGRRGPGHRDGVAPLEPGAGLRGIDGDPTDPVVEAVGQRVAVLVARLEGEIAVADQVEEAHLGARGGRERYVGVHLERHHGLVALVVLDLLDLADADAGHADVVALLEHRRVGEDRLVLVASPKPKLPMIAASSPVTRIETIVKMRSLMPAAMVTELRRLRSLAALRAACLSIFASAFGSDRSSVAVLTGRHHPSRPGRRGASRGRRRSRRVGRSRRRGVR